MMHNDVMANRVIDKNGSVVRATVSFAHEIYDSLEKIAASKKVSIAWVVRDAVEFYLSSSARTDTVPAPAVSVWEEAGDA
jgi:predicted DNA-binding ribbon-helix-helix protein